MTSFPLPSRSTSTAEPLPQSARRIIATTTAIALAIMVYSVATWESADLLKYAGFLLVTVFSAGMRLGRPRGRGYLSLNFLFVLFAVAELSTPETIALAAAAGLAHSLWTSSEHTFFETGFDVAVMVLGAAVVERVFHSDLLLGYGFDPALRLLAGAFALFLMQSVPSAAVSALRDGESFVMVWSTQHRWALPYYLAGTMVAGVMTWANRLLGWQTVLLTGPVVYLIFRSYRLYLERLEEERLHAEDVSSLHLRTIEALALAIDAKDQTTHEHLQRVKIYAMEIANDLGVSQEEKDALCAASLLHDIGKLAVPEHIISKPGRLTPEEFEKMKIHPVVGAEILERVQFPYPVVPIVRSHHEKWDGSGYPYGLSGENIPIGARILAAVDCLDALATDRQYRRAIPLDDAMKVVISESGKAFDPKVVEVLSRRYVELEKQAQAQGSMAIKPSIDLRMRDGVAPAAGFEASSPAYPRKNPEKDFLSSIAAARHEVQALFEISQDLGNSLSLDETLSVLGVRLRRIIPHHALAIWIRRDGILVPEYVNGEDYRLLSSMQIAVGQGLSGWVAENGKPILNGNPAVEPGNVNDPGKFSNLKSAVAVPLEGGSGVLGVLTLYHLERDAFSKDHLRILLGISTKIGMSIENVMRFRQVESSATTDFLTTLPNARSLFLQLDAELARCRREENPLAVLVLDLDGFKAMNDKLGHLEGNKMLRSVGAGLKAACREYDYVARMGGDEFVVLLPGVRPQDIDAKTAQFREVVASAGRERMIDADITASIGIAHFPKDGSDAETLLAESDRRMYQEKRTRKNSRAATTKPFLLRTGS